MVCFGAPGFILLFLFNPAFGIGNLENIISYLQKTYKLNNQHALGINVPVKYCEKGTELDQNFLPAEDAQQVQAAMNGVERIYKGTRLISAKPKQISDTMNNYHSEYLLLIKSESKTFARFDPLMQTLLNSDPNGCTVFFTMNSPCVKTCSTPRGPYSIIPALQMFHNRNDKHKAFVFNQVWKNDDGSEDWENNILEINKKIPVFRCYNKVCVRCVNNNIVDIRCKSNFG